MLDGVLARREYLVSGRYSFVDSAFLTWFSIVPQFLGDVIDLEAEFPSVGAWLARLHARPAIAKVVKDRAEAMAVVTPSISN
jgi:glutathione S-transferase